MISNRQDMVDAYVRGSATNGKVWAEWLGVDKVISHHANIMILKMYNTWAVRDKNKNNLDPRR